MTLRTFRASTALIIRCVCRVVRVVNTILYTYTYCVGVRVHIVYIYCSASASAVLNYKPQISVDFVNQRNSRSFNMTTHQLSLNECNTPWWYETPSLASQSTFSSNTYCTGTSQIDPFDITPSQSSGYYDEDTTASEASSNMFTGGPGSYATGSEWSDNGTSMRSVARSSHHRPPAAGDAGGGACMGHSGAAHTRVSGLSCTSLS
jgi:hypothetical protein